LSGISPAAVAFASACSAPAPLVVVAAAVVAGGAVVVVGAPERPPDPHPAPTTLMVTARKSEADNRMTVMIRADC